MTYLITALIGLFAGLVSGLFGVGGGTVFVPFLILFKKMSIHMAVGTSLALVVPTALIGAAKHGMMGHIDWRAVPVLLVLSLIGAWLGATFSSHFDAQLLRRLYGVFLLALAVKMFLPN